MRGALTQQMNNIKGLLRVLGSSPRMRGAHSADCWHAWPYGIIPADAGSTARKIVVCVPVADHPRGCGEHNAVTYKQNSAQGSSPRMRGAHLEQLHLAASGRIIPADAGSTGGHRLYTLCKRDHPRGCGEHLYSCSVWSNKSGSSPRMRGALVPEAFLEGMLGIIPADAGSTPSRSYPWSAIEDHPRGCGEHRLSFKL